MTPTHQNLISLQRVEMLAGERAIRGEAREETGPCHAGTGVFVAPTRVHSTLAVAAGEPYQPKSILHVHRQLRNHGENNAESTVHWKAKGEANIDAPLAQNLNFAL